MPYARPGRTLLLGLLGYPIAHSAAPAMMESAGAALGIRVHYQLLPVENADQATLGRMIDAIRLTGFAGINVTFPYKEAVLPFIDTLSEGAAALRAVNVILVGADGRLSGHNTDATGFRRVAASLGNRLASGPVALIGAGGAGRAMGWGLLEAGAPSLAVFDPDPSRCAALAAALGTDRVRIVPRVEDAVDGAAGIVNASPVGMLPDTRSPVPAELIRPGMFVADAVYHPPLTPLLAAAQAAGARVVPGRAMSVAQGVDGFALFSGTAPPEEAVAAGFDQAIGA
ncbi:shikimate dehydrogenase [Elioraea sp.]|uniref:shikimate dehydrogenase n=1 Tax=Elioraea sp. TaxID=2185103 RepID=UPI0025C35ED5|nr:shikimate dehydrogenase [Elioraea sp.]